MVTMYTDMRTSSDVETSIAMIIALNAHNKDRGIETGQDWGFVPTDLQQLVGGGYRLVIIAEEGAAAWMPQNGCLHLCNDADQSRTYSNCTIDDSVDGTLSVNMVSMVSYLSKTQLACKLLMHLIPHSKTGIPITNALVVKAQIRAYNIFHGGCQRSANIERIPNKVEEDILELADYYRADLCILAPFCKPPLPPLPKPTVSNILSTSLPIGADLLLPNTYIPVHFPKLPEPAAPKGAVPAALGRAQRNITDHSHSPNSSDDWPQLGSSPTREQHVSASVKINKFDVARLARVSHGGRIWDNKEVQVLSEFWKDWGDWQLLKSPRSVVVCTIKN